MKGFTRREALRGIAAGGAGLALTSSNGSNAAGKEATESINEQGADTSQVARAFRGQHQPRALQFDPAKLKGISEKLIRSHHENNYTGAVRALNGRTQMRGRPEESLALKARIFPSGEILGASTRETPSGVGISKRIGLAFTGARRM